MGSAMPADCVFKILSYLSEAELGILIQVSWRIRSFAEDELFTRFTKSTDRRLSEIFNSLQDDNRNVAQTSKIFEHCKLKEKVFRQSLYKIQITNAPESWSDIPYSYPKRDF